MLKELNWKTRFRGLEKPEYGNTGQFITRAGTKIPDRKNSKEKNDTVVANIQYSSLLGLLSRSVQP